MNHGEEAAYKQGQRAAFEEVNRHLLRVIVDVGADKKTSDFAKELVNIVFPALMTAVNTMKDKVK